MRAFYFRIGLFQNKSIISFKTESFKRINLFTFILQTIDEQI